ncbi:MAG: zinc-ribbon domain-containing protein [Deltaproteobacteria bacterium]|nr:zinc-ribbon domain-containing protein [Deltaproteobacteria bacterium]
MIVECGKCGTKFRLDDAKIGPRGARVRCAKCQHGFVVNRPDATAVPEINLEIPAPAYPGPNPFEGAGAPQPVPLDNQATVPSIGSLDLDFDSVPMTGAVHEAQTAIYTVPPQFNPTPEPAAIDLDAEDDASHPNAAAPPASPLFDARSSTTSPMELPPLPVVPNMPAPALPPPAAGAEAELVSDDDITFISPPTTDAPPPAVAVVPAPSVALGAGAPPPPVEDLADPFAVLDTDGAIAADGTLVPPSAGADAAAPEPVPSALDHSELPRTMLARISPESLAPKATTPGVASVALDAGRGWSLGVKILMWLVSLLLLAGGILFYIGGGALDLSVFGVRLPSQHRIELAEGYGGLRATAMRSVLYPTKNGKQVLVFAGIVANQSAEPQPPADVIGEVLDGSGRVLATDRAPLGLTLGPRELTSIDDNLPAAELFKPQVAKNGRPPLAAGAVAPFTVVIAQPPPGLAALTHRVRLDKSEVAAPPPPPKPALPTVAPESEDSEDDAKSKKKGAKDKGKKKLLKGKRKAKGAAAAPADAP